MAWSTAQPEWRWGSMNDIFATSHERPQWHRLLIGYGHISICQNLSLAPRKGRNQEATGKRLDPSSARSCDRWDVNDMECYRVGMAHIGHYSWILLKSVGMSLRSWFQRQYATRLMASCSKVRAIRLRLLPGLSSDFGHCELFGLGPM